MTASASLILGALLGAAHAAAALLGVRKVRAASPMAVLRTVLGGMMIRMALTLGVFAAILIAVPVQRGPFVLGLGVVFALGLAAEAYFVLGRPAPTPDPSDS